MRIFNGLKGYIPGAFALFEIVSSCVAPSESTNYFRKLDYAMDKLGVGDTSMLVFLPDGYITSKIVKGTLTTLAGIEAGTVKVVRTNGRYFAQGSYSQVLNPEAMEKVCRDSDTNEDKIITWEEATRHSMELYEEHAK